MSIGPSGIAGSVAGGHLTQRQGSDVDRASQETANQSRQVSGEKRAEKSSGVGETEGDQEASDRDGDGHKLWEESPQPQADNPPSESETRQSKDPDGNTGTRLDISG